ncbi:UMP kinase [bacterium]|nr:UMP kinase [bacterium]MBU1063763.1 UMP kinase [bacterium]MBU1635712.1 UMP kinase [bacterium]MBU1873761.1 UMP kinase [bacterium]
MLKAKYQRVLLKFSGEALAGAKGFGIDPAVLDDVCTEIQSAKDLGIELGIVIGGGNIFRGLAASERGMDRVKADYMGMLATVINALAVQDALESKGMKVTVMSAIQMIDVAEPMIIRKAEEYLKNGQIVIFSAGTGRPFFSTDTGAALRAVEIHADAIIKATKVDGVYDKDPVKHPDAILFKTLNYQTVVENQLKVMDLTAITLCQDNKLPILVYNMNVKGNLRRLLTGEDIGTLISRGDHA